MKIDLAQSLSALTGLNTPSEVGGPPRNPVLEELDKPEVKTALIALILNEIRAYKTATQQVRVGDSILTTNYDTIAGFAKLTAFVDLLDIPALIEAKTEKPSPMEQDRLPED